ncbi:hypothetical protein V8J38_11270 [Brevundimonas olei]|uniref:Uncharacterized protein n=1 Tax=Brevundimonas olei TaxID=657642 RepID=A0ABZ2I874_9CAUL
MTSTNAQLFAAAGKALYGERWQQPLAALLGWPLDERGQNRTVQRIKAAAERGEEYRISPNVMQELSGHLDGHAALLQAISASIRDAQTKP